MKVVVQGQCLSVRSGQSKTGKDFVVANIFDGDDLIKVFGVDPQTPLGDISIPCRLDFNIDSGKLFFSAIK